MSLSQAQVSNVTQNEQSSWNKMFPAKVETAAESLKFTKKLLTVGVSELIYSRKMLPEEAFADKKLNKVS